MEGANHSDLSSQGAYQATQEGAPAPAPNELAVVARRLSGFIYASNPFYLISAALMFAGLRVSFDTTGTGFETGTLMAALVGYTTLLAVTAFLLIRFGKVWDDARSLLLLIVAMFLAISVTFDDALAASATWGAVYFIGGWLFAAATSEALLWGLGIRMGLRLRGPFHLILALFFLYPTALRIAIFDPANSAMQWGLFGFSVAAAAIFLLLLPAVRGGAAYVRSNGTPWAWPWFPWTLFVVLGLAVCLRASYLCTSLHFVPGSWSIFGPYFLVPFLLAMALLLLEAVLVSGNRRFKRLVLLAPVAILLLAVTPQRTDPVFTRFLDSFTTTLGGSPLYLTLLLAIGFYGVAATRRVAWAGECFVLAVAALAAVGPATFDTDSLRAAWGAPLIVAAVLQGSLAATREDSRRWVWASAFLLGSVAIELQDTSLAPFGPFIAVQLLIVSLLVGGIICRDRFRAVLQYAGAALIVLASMAVVSGQPHFFGETPPAVGHLYPFLAALAALSYGFGIGNRAYYAAAAGSLGAWLGIFGWNGYRLARHYVLGLDKIALGMTFFLLAAAVSMLKAGIVRPFGTRQTREGRGQPERPG